MFYCRSESLERIFYAESRAIDGFSSRYRSRLSANTINNEASHEALKLSNMPTNPSAKKDSKQALYGSRR